MNLSYSSQINPTKHIILPFMQDEVNMEQIKAISGVSGIEFKGKHKEIITMYGGQGNLIHLVGLGTEKDLPKLTVLFTHLSFQQVKNWKGEIQLDASHLNEVQLTQVITGLAMGDYKIGRYKKKEEKKTPTLNEITIVNAVNETAAQKGLTTAETINDVKHIVDAPANVKTPEYLAQWAKASAKKYGYKCRIFDEEGMKQKGFHAALAVGRGSQHPSRIVICEHKPKKDEAVELLLVGKGVTFDTGGISIKPSNNMHYMKSDMGGAAAVLGTMELIARLGIEKNVVGIIGTVENAVDALSYLPGDIIDSHSGKTIEVINTDAEGRLVLADCLSYGIKKYKPKQVIDLATLTGSAVQALGYSAAALFSKNEEMKQQMMRIGNEIHERVWPMPLFDEFADDLHSDVADISNLGATPVAGAITAAKFLEAFTEDHESWMHLDIAGVAFGNNDNAKMKSATGYGIRLISSYIEQM